MAVKNYHTISAGTVQRDVNNGSVNFGKWQAPPHGWFKVNRKASVDTKNGRVGLGAAIIRIITNQVD
jgi:hypothetical protein